MKTEMSTEKNEMNPMLAFAGIYVIAIAIAMFFCVCIVNYFNVNNSDESFTKAPPEQNRELVVTSQP